jgi:hypothetical protein
MKALTRGQEKLYCAWADSPGPAFNLEAGRDRFGSAARQHATARRRSVSREVAWLSAAAALLVVAFGLWNRSVAPLTFNVPGGQGEVGAWLATDASTELPLSFSENTEIVLAQDSRGRVEELHGDGAHFLLERGAVRAEVVHRLGANWRFSAGPFEVRVTGTALSVAWNPSTERLAVHVSHGSVVVHGPYVGGERVVRGGESCIVDIPSKTMRFAADGADEQSAADDSAATDEPVVGPTNTPAATEAARPPPSLAPWAKLEEQGDYDGAYAAAQHTGTTSLYRGASADVLIELAKVGVLSGHGDMQRDALLACRRRFPGTHQASLAAYELGRASGAIEAKSWFETYLEEQPSGPLAREALGRLLEADSLARDQSAARDVARRYLFRYPNGPHAALARRTLAEPNDGP